MVVTDRDTINTFVFSEKDLPGYRKYSHDRAPSRIKDNKRVEKSRGSGINFRRAVPSMFPRGESLSLRADSWRCRANESGRPGPNGDKLSPRGECRFSAVRS